jgi:hypothetical protein
MRAEMARAGTPATVAPSLHYLWALSAVLRAESGDLACYLKCSALVFHSEASLSATLAAVTPDLVTPVIAVEPEEGWLLMGDFGSRLMGQEPVSQWTSGLEAHALVQRTWVDHQAQLLTAGAQTRPLRQLADVIPGLADHPPTAAHLSDAERAAWDSAAPRLLDACRRLDALGPRDTLVHGDLHPWNVVLHDGRCRIVDWSDTAVGHPFVDLATYVFRTDDALARRQMLDAYLAHWADDLGPSALAEAGRLALVVGCLYQAHTYQMLLAALDPEDTHELMGSGASWLRRAVAVQEAGIEYVRTGRPAMG